MSEQPPEAVQLPAAPEFPVGTVFSTTGSDGKKRTWEVRSDGQVKQDRSTPPRSQDARLG